MKNYLTEFIGTFFLCLTICGAVISGSAVAPIAIGAALMVMVYMGGHISGGHYNPAVSLAAALRGALSRDELLPYWVAQLLGAIVAGLVSLVTFGKVIAPAPASTANPIGIFLMEMLFTFALALVVLNSATTKKTEGNSFYGLAIGFTVAAGAVAAGWYSGGAFNPAVGVGLNLAKAISGGGLNMLAIAYYIIGPLAGGAIAAYVYRIQHA